MSVYNGERYLREAMDSILCQSLEDFEFIVIDDASTDGTADILAGYRDPRLVLARNRENLGLTRSLNRGLQIAKGEFIARQDADDISLPERLAVESAFLKENPDTILVSSNIEYINSEGRRLGRSDRACPPELVSWFLMFYNHVGGHSQVMFRRQEALRLSGYSESMRFSQDHDLWLRMNKIGKIAILPDVLVRCRRHDQSISKTARNEQETLSIEASRRVIGELVGSEVDPKAVATLRRFWLGPFPSGESLGEVNESLKRIYRAFVRVPQVCGLVSWQVRRDLRKAIARQFIYWRYGFDRHREFGLKIRASVCASSWHTASLVGGPVERHHN